MKTYLLEIKHCPPYISNYLRGEEHSQVVQERLAATKEDMKGLLTRN